MDKVVLITGASRGIGAALLSSFATAGYACVGTATGAKGVEAIKANAGKGMLLDVTNKDSVADLASALEAESLLPDILINNAGITCDKLFLSMQSEDWESVIHTNLLSLYAVNRCFLKPMLKKRWGRIISIASVVGLMGNPGQTNYAASKAGMLGFTRSLAQEVAPRNITVNAIAPGYIESDMTKSFSDAQKQKILEHIPSRRFGTGEDVAAVARFLASDSAGYITGETISCNGGMYCQ